ncbi:ATP-binding protein [Lacinutrix chionoecetis]
MSNTFDAAPTKEFFISMLVRDINLKDAIGDLVDNCIDGAKNIRGNGDFNNLYINITINNNEFKIKDNCGGIDIEIARKYAFRFGRPENSESDIKYSIGQFGIGMKRAFFKIGRRFIVNTKTINNSFRMNVDVNDWSKDSNWTFTYDESEDFKVPIDITETGTSIIVKDLNSDVETAFTDNRFLQSLQNDLELDHLYNLNKGLKIIFNGNRLKPKKLKFNVSEDIKIGNWEHTFDNGVKVKLLVGVGEQAQDLGGWYIFCNDRLIVGPDTTELTGWTGRGNGGVANYHHQYYRFRGYAFFNSEDSEKLPWNTTKTGMDLDSPIFKHVRGKMIEMMKTVVNGFLNPLKKENESTYKGDKVLNNSIENTDSLNITDNDINNFYSQDRSFAHPVPAPSNNRVSDGKTKIQYEVDKESVKKMKKNFNLSTNEDVGLYTFNYVFENEIADNE